MRQGLGCIEVDPELADENGSLWSNDAVAANWVCSTHHNGLSPAEMVIAGCSDLVRALWSDPVTRRKLLEGLSGRGFGSVELAEIQKLIDAEKSDLFDVLAYIAYARAPMTREQRSVNAKAGINQVYRNNRELSFLEFVLQHYVDEGVSELDMDKLPPLLKLKYRAISDAASELGSPEQIKSLFIGFQSYLYQE